MIWLFLFVDLVKYSERLSLRGAGGSPTLPLLLYVTDMPCNTTLRSAVSRRKVIFSADRQVRSIGTIQGCGMHFEKRVACVVGRPEGIFHSLRREEELIAVPSLLRI